MFYFLFVIVVALLTKGYTWALKGYREIIIVVFVRYRGG